MSGGKKDFLPVLTQQGDSVKALRDGQKLQSARDVSPSMSGRRGRAGRRAIGSFC